MQKNTKKLPKQINDFFSSYRFSQLRKYFFSLGLALFVSFSFVSIYHGDINMNSLMASVANVTEEPRYDADLIMTRKDKNLTITF